MTVVVSGFGCWKVLKCLHFCWVWLHTLCNENDSIGYLWVSDATFVPVEDDVIFWSAASIS